MEHSKLPWRIDNDHKCIASADDTAILKYRYSIGPKQLANAEYIVRACNAFPKLVDMIKDFASRIRDSGEWWMVFPDRGGFDLDAIEVLIALATPPVEPEKE